MTFLYPYTSFDPATLVITNTGAAWTVNEFADAWVFFVGQDGRGIQNYGTVDSNDATTITLSGMITSADPDATGNILIYTGYTIEFLPDLSQPSVVRNLDVNKDCFEYNDNDDKRKLSTKIVASGKDLFGKTISVMLAAVHAYDNDKQMFKDATIITRRSEGYVYKNNYVTAANRRAVTATPATSDLMTTYVGAGFPTYIKPAGNYAKYVLNAEVYFSATTGTLPSNITAGTHYYIVSRTGGDKIEISTTPLGAALDVGTDAIADCYVSTDGGLIISNTDSFISNLTQIVLIGTTAPGGISLGSTITNNSPTYSSADYWINPGVVVGAGVGSGLSVYLLSALQNSQLGTSPACWLYNWSYTIPSGATMAFCVPNSGTAGLAATSIAATTESTDSSGVQYTNVPLSTMPETDFSGRGYLLNARLYVQKESYVGANEVLIGEEKITIDSSGNDTTYGNYIQFADPTARVTSATLKAYPHDVGALVARTNYTEAAPETNAAINTPANGGQGIHIGNFTVDGNITYGALDTYATYMLLGLGNFYRKANTWAPLIYGYVDEVGVFHGSAQVSHKRPIAIGDRISITPFDGDTPVEYEVVEVTINHDEHRITLQLGDFDKNVFTSLEQKTNALNRTLS